MSEDWIQEFRDKLVWGPLPWKHVAKRWREHALILEDEKSDIEATAQRLRGLLREMEWVDFGPDAVFPEPKIWKQCLICEQWIEYGHADDCELAKELKDG